VSSGELGRALLRDAARQGQTAGPPSARGSRCAAFLPCSAYEAFDFSSFSIETSRNVIRGNLVIGTIKDMSGKSSHDLIQPGSIDVLSATNVVEDNVVAGSERYCYTYYGLPCGGFTAGSFRNNTGHACLAGMWLRASPESMLAGCTLVQNFTTYMNWDFGIISTKGIPTDVQLQEVNVLDSKHVGE
jgi:hypothetical protein